MFFAAVPPRESKVKNTLKTFLLSFDSVCSTRRRGNFHTFWQLFTRSLSIRSPCDWKIPCAAGLHSQDYPGVGPAWHELDEGSDPIWGEILTSKQAHFSTGEFRWRIWLFPTSSSPRVACGSFWQVTRPSLESIGDIIQSTISLYDYIFFSSKIHFFSTSV